MLTYSRADRANQAILDQLATKCREIQDLRKQLEARCDKIEHILASLSSAHRTVGKDPFVVVPGTPGLEGRWKVDVALHVPEVPVAIEYTTAAHRLLTRRALSVSI